MASRFWVGGTASWTAINLTSWSATSGGAGGATVPGVGDDVTFDGASGGGVVTVGAAYNPSVNSITMGSFTGTLDFSANNNSPTMGTFNGSGAGTRTLNMGNGTWTLTGNATTIFNLSTTTGLTFSAGSSTINCTYSGSTGTRTLSVNGASFPLNNVSISAGSDIVNFPTTATTINGNLNFTGFSGSRGNGATLFIGGNLTMGTGMTVVNTSNNLITLFGTGSQTITTNAVRLNQNISITGVGGTYTLQDNMDMTGADQASPTFTLTNGTFNANNFNVTCGGFSSSNSNVRTLTMGSGIWTFTGNATTVWSIATGTNLTMTVTTASVVCNYTGSVGSRTFSSGIIGSPTAAPKFFITGGTDIINFTPNSAPVFQSIDFTGFGGSVVGPSNSLSIRDTFILSPTMSFNLTGTGGLIFNGGSINSSLGTVSANGVVMGTAITFSGVGGSWILGTNLVATGSMSLLIGTLNANNKSVTVSSFIITSSSARTLTMGSGTFTLTGTGTVWDATTVTNLTLTQGTSTIVITDTSSAANTFSGGGLTYNNLTFARGTSIGNNVIIGSNTFAVLADTGSAAHSFGFTAGTTTSFTTWNINGSGSASLITLTSTTAATHTLKNLGTSDVVANYLAISFSIAT